MIRLDQGKLVPVNRAAFHGLVDQNICVVRPVEHDGEWQREYFTYRFAPAPRINPSRPGPWPEPDESEPDDKVLDQIYRHEL
jgi:hypothetical protein